MAIAARLLFLGWFSAKALVVLIVDEWSVLGANLHARVRVLLSNSLLIGGLFRAVYGCVESACSQFVARSSATSGVIARTIFQVASAEALISHVVIVCSSCYFIIFYKLGRLSIARINGETAS